MFEDIVFPGIVFFGGFLAGLLIIAGNRESSKELLWVFSASFLTKSILAASFYFLSSNGFLFINDGFTYHYNGWTILQMWQKGIMVTPEVFYGHSASGTLSNYDFWNAFVYSVTGKSPLTLFLMNAMVSSLTIVFIYYVTNNLFGKKEAVISAIICVVWPSLIMWSTQNMKEPLINFGICGFIWAVINLRTRFKITYLATLVIASFIILQLRSFMFYLLVAIVPVWWLITSEIWQRAKIVVIFSAVLLLVSIGFLFISGLTEHLHDIQMFFVKSYEKNLSFDSLYSFLGYSRDVRAYGTTAIMPGYKLTSALSIAVFLPIGFLYVFFSPFPWQFASAGQIIALPEMMMFYFLTPFLTLGIIYTLKHKIAKSYILLFFIFCSSLTLALIEGNVGTLFRHRSAMLYFLFVFAAVGIAHFKRKTSHAG